MIGDTWQKNRFKLQNFLNEYDDDLEVLPPVPIDGEIFWIIEGDLPLIELREAFDKKIVIHKLMDSRYYFINHNQLCQEYGNDNGIFDFNNGFIVKGKSRYVIEERLHDYGFGYFGSFFGVIGDDDVLFIRVSSTNDSVKKRFCEVLNLSFDDVGCILDDSDILAGSAWFYFKV